MKTGKLHLTLLITLFHIGIFFNHLYSQTQKTLLGVTYTGGLNGFGKFFSVPTDSSNLNFNYDLDLITGSRPGRQANLILATNGKIYGMTRYGGSYDNGIIFEFDPISFVLTKKTELNPDNNYNNGKYPEGSLFQASNGKLYGFTSEGAANNKGILFEYDITTNTLTKKIEFLGTSNGANPFGSLIEARNGKLYGMTKYGGANNKGTIFEYEITTNTLTKIFDFNYAYGIFPEGNLIQATNNKLYGLTTESNVSLPPGGTLFEFDINTNIFTKKVDFTGISGYGPISSLVQATNGKLYGTTWRGGLNDKGIVFEYDITTNQCIKKIDFDSQIHGANPFGTLMLATNGNLYGTASMGGVNNGGTIYKYDYTTNSITKIFDFNSPVNGASPKCSLLEIDAPVNIGIEEHYFRIKKNSFLIFPNPTSEGIHILSEEKQTISILNSIGQILFKLDLEKDERTYLKLQSGIYLIHTDQGAQVEKIIVD